MLPAVGVGGLDCVGLDWVGLGVGVGLDALDWVGLVDWVGLGGWVGLVDWVGLGVGVGLVVAGLVVSRLAEVGSVLASGS